MTNTAARWSVTVSSAPPAEPITLAETKAHLNIDADDTQYDDYLDALIGVVREKIESELNRALVRQTQILTLDCFPRDRIIRVPNPPLASVVSVEYYDTANALQTVDASNYVVDTASEPGRIEPNYNYIWPITRYQIAGVRITYTCGYAPSSDSPTDYGANVPKAIKQAMKLTIGTLFENRESIVVGSAQAIVLPDAVENLIWSKRILAV